MSSGGFWRSILRALPVGLLVATAGGVALASAPKKPEPRMRGQVTYKPIGYDELPGWAADDHLSAFRTFLASCDRLITMARERAAAGKSVPPVALVEACNIAKRQPANISKAAARTFFEANFVPNKPVHNGRPGLLTGYYEPVLMGSRTPDATYQTPIYKRPPELVTLIEETRGSRASALTHGRKTEKGFEPYFTRAQIEQGALKGKNLELVYFAEPVDVFFMQIQGSGRVKLTDGSTIRVNYDGKNGHPYASIGRYLIEKGLFAADKVSLTALRSWLQSDRERGKTVMWQNPSFVFFKEVKEDGDKGPLGALGVPLTAGRSLAIDPSYHALGTPVFVMADNMQHVTKSGVFSRLMVAQDVGSAIKGPERGDIYFGSGDAAGKVAGSTRQQGSFVVLLPNPGASADAGKPTP